MRTNGTINNNHATSTDSNSILLSVPKDQNMKKYVFSADVLCKQFRPNQILDMILISTVWYFDVIPEMFFFVKKTD